MLRRVVIGVAMTCLMGGAAYAVDEGAVDNECTEQLTTAEETVHDRIESNALSEADADKVNELLDQADALCTEGKFAEASATLATVNKLVGKSRIRTGGDGAKSGSRRPLLRGSALFRLFSRQCLGRASLTYPEANR